MKFDKKIMRTVVIILLLFAVVLSIINIVIYSSNLVNRDIANEKNIEKYKYHFALIFDSKNTEKWNEIYENANKYAMENNAYIDVIGYNLPESYTKEELFEIAVLSDVDGIIVEGDDGEKLASYIDSAYRNQIPVVTVMSDVPGSMRISYVGLGSYDVGKELAVQIDELCIENKTNDIMVLMSGSEGYQEQHTMYQAILENKSADNNVNVDVKLVYNDNEFSTDEAIRDIFINMDKLPDIMVCLSDNITESAFQQVVDYNKVKSIDVIGLASSEKAYEAVEKKLIDSVISFDKMKMGTSCVDALIEYIENGYVSEYYMVETNLVTQKNVRRFMENEEQK